MWFIDCSYMYGILTVCTCTFVVLVYWLGDLILRVCTFTKCKCVIYLFLSLPLVLSPSPPSSLSLLLLPPPPPLLPLTPSQAMLLFTGSAVFNSELSSTFKRLAEDENSKVRRTVASGFHEVRREREGGMDGGRKGGRKGGREGEKGKRKGKERGRKQKVWSQQQKFLTSQVTKLLETSCFSVASCYQQLLKDPSVEVCTFQFFFKVE